jgi:hypothetical protein
VYRTVYGWEQTFVRLYGGGEGAGHFRWDIDETAYKRGAATVSRAIRRLVQRGLVTPNTFQGRPFPGDWTLTAAGLALAEQLSVTGKNVP